MPCSAVPSRAAGCGQPLETSRRDEPRAGLGRPRSAAATLVRSVRHTEGAHGMGKREGKGGKGGEEESNESEMEQDEAR